MNREGVKGIRLLEKLVLEQEDQTGRGIKMGKREGIWLGTEKLRTIRWFIWKSNTVETFHNKSICKGYLNEITK